MSDTNSNTQGLLSAHVTYVKGRIESAIGDISGSEAWKHAGEVDTQQGVDAMKHAEESRHPTGSKTLGQIEKTAGQWTGCEGMVKEGQVKMDKSQE